MFLKASVSTGNQLLDGDVQQLAEVSLRQECDISMRQIPGVAGRRLFCKAFAVVSCNWHLKL